MENWIYIISVIASLLLGLKLKSNCCGKICYCSIEKQKNNDEILQSIRITKRSKIKPISTSGARAESKKESETNNSSAANLISAPGCARHVSYILSSSSSKYNLPWHRVVNSKGCISLPVQNGYFEQKKKLENEKVIFTKESIDLEKYEWRPTKSRLKEILKNLPLHIPARAR